MERLESDEYQKTWIRCVTYCHHTLPGDEPLHLRLKITFFLDSQRLMALLPSAAHESLLKILQKDINCQAPTISALLLRATPTKKGTSLTGGGTTLKGGDASPT